MTICNPNGNLAAIKIGGQRVWERDSYTGTQQCVPKRRQNSIPKNQ